MAGAPVNLPVRVTRVSGTDSRTDSSSQTSDTLSHLADKSLVVYERQ